MPVSEKYLRLFLFVMILLVAILVVVGSNRPQASKLVCKEYPSVEVQKGNMVAVASTCLKTEGEYLYTVHATIDGQRVSIETVGGLSVDPQVSINAVSTFYGYVLLIGKTHGARRFESFYLIKMTNGEVTKEALVSKN